MSCAGDTSGFALIEAGATFASAKPAREYAGDGIDGALGAGGGRVKPVAMSRRRFTVARWSSVQRERSQLRGQAS